MLAASSVERRPSGARPTPLDLPLFLPYASCQLQAPYRVRVLLETQEEYVSPTAPGEKSKKAVARAKSTATGHTSRSRTHTSSQERAGAEESDAQREARDRDEEEIVVAAIHDPAERLVELAFVRGGEVPRLLLQILALCVPHQPHLERLSVRRARLAGAALHELGKLLPFSRLTDVCLDGSPVPERNYAALLRHERVRRLSLARCDLGDEGCASLASELAHPRPAGRSLRSLGLACNAIGDVGAAALAAALRTNRSLQHLDLAGNRITDAGACAIFRTLVEFPLTYEELVTKRRRFVEFLRLRREVYLRCVEELARAGPAAAEEGARGGKRRTVSGAGARGRKASSGAVSSCASAADAGAAAARAETMANEAVGAYADPFGLEETTARGGYLLSLGNTSLCWLNLAHNELTHASAAALLGVLRYQAALVRKAGPGLLRAGLEGNPLPAACAEYAALHDLLDAAVQWKLSKQLKKTDKSKSKTHTK